MKIISKNKNFSLNYNIRKINKIYFIKMKKAILIPRIRIKFKMKKKLKEYNQKK
jgi:hypothetical protein